MIKKILFGILVVFGLLISARAEEDPADASVQFKQARTYQKKGFYKQAEAIYQDILQNYAGTGRALRAQKKLVVLHILEENSAGTQTALDKLTTDFSSDSNLPDALCRVARRYEMLGKCDKANSIYQRIIQQYPDSSYAHRARLGIEKSQILSYVDAGDDSEVLAATDILANDFSGHPDLPEALYHIAKGYRGRNRYIKANSLYQQIIQQHPDSSCVDKVRLHIEKGRIWSSIDTGNDSEAQAATDKLTADFSGDSGLPAALYRIARRYEGQGKYEEAQDVYQKIMQQYPDSVYAGKAQLDIPKAEILFFIDDDNDTFAQQTLDRLISDFNGHPHLPVAIFVVGEQYYNQGLTYRHEGLAAEANERYRKALSVWERIIKDLPVSTYTADAYYFSARCYHRLCEYEKAIEYYERIVSDWPDGEYAGKAKYLIGECFEGLRYSGSLPESEANPKIEQAYIAVVENYPDCPSAREAALKLGWLNFNRGQWADAALYFELFLLKRTDSQSLRYVVSPLGQAYEKMGELDSAADAYNEFINTVHPDDPRIEKVRARLEALQGTKQ